MSKLAYQGKEYVLKSKLDKLQSFHDKVISYQGKRVTDISGQEIGAVSASFGIKDDGTLYVIANDVIINQL